MNLLTFVAWKFRFQFCFQSIQRYIREYGRDYNTNNVAKKTIDFSISVSREQLRPNYGDGFRGVLIEDSANGRSGAKQNRGKNEQEESETAESEV